MSDGYTIPVIEVPLPTRAAVDVPAPQPSARAALRDDVTLVAVGSLNPVKVGAVRGVLAPLVPGVAVKGVMVASTVAAQPWGDEETIRGARARAVAALARVAEAELAVGIEGGVVDGEGGLRTCAWAVVIDRAGTEGVGGSLAVPLPPAVAALVRNGEELGAAMDSHTGQSNTKQGGGAVGVLTAGLIDRQRAYEALVTYALAPFLAGEHWR